MAISLFLLNIVFIIGSITYPSEVCTLQVSQTQSSDFSFVGLSFIVEPEIQVVTPETESIKLTCRGFPGRSDDDMRLSPGDSFGLGTNFNNRVSEPRVSASVSSSARRTIFSNPNSDLNIKDRTNAQSKRKHGWKNKKRHRKSRHAGAIEPLRDLNYSWYRDGVLLSNASDNVLVVRFVNDTENAYGNYRCVASKKNIGAIASTISRILKPVLNSPIVKALASDEVVIGSNVLLLCEVESIPKPQITWNKDGTTITLNDRMFLLPTGSLIINNIELEDSGLYSCSVTNNVLGKTRSSVNFTLEIRIDLTDKHKTNFSDTNKEMSWSNLNSHNVSVNEHTDIYMPCAIPTKNVNWTFKPKKGYYHLNNKPDLHLLGVKEDQSGIYECSENRNISHYKRRYMLEVYSKPHFITTPSDSYTLSPKNVRFNCSAEGYPTPKITWYKDGVPLYINGRVKIKANSLVISDTQASDAGIYQCIANNTVSEASVSAILQFANDIIHSAPKGVRCFPLNNATIVVEWEKTADDIFTLHYVKSAGGTEEQKLTQYEHTYEVENLKPFISYDFYVKRYHKEEGKISPSEQSEIVKCSPQGLFVTAHTENTSDIIVQWSVPKISNDAKIKTYLLQWRFKNKPKNITEVILNGNVTKFQIYDVRDLSSFEVRVLASYNDVFQEQNLDNINWAHVTNKSNMEQNQLGMSSENLSYIYVVYPPNMFRVQDINNKVVNISWDQDDQKDAVYQICYAASDVMWWPDKCVNRSDTWVIINDLLVQYSYEFSIMKYTENLLDSKKIYGTLYIHRAYGEIQNLSAYWLYNTTTALVSWLQPSYYIVIQQYKLRYCSGPSFLQCHFQTHPVGTYSSKIENLDVTNSVLITMYVEMQDGKGKPISFKLLPLQVVAPVEPNPMLGIILGVTISVFFVLLCVVFVLLCSSKRNARSGRSLCCKNSGEQCWKNDRDAYTTSGSTAEDDHVRVNVQRLDSFAYRRECRESLLLQSEPNQNIEMQCWKQRGTNAKTPAIAMTNPMSVPTAVLEQESPQNMSTRPLLEEIISALQQSEDETDMNLYLKSYTMQPENAQLLLKNCRNSCGPVRPDSINNLNIKQLESQVKNDQNDIKKSQHIDENDDSYKELSFKSRIKEILIGNNDNNTSNVKLLMNGRNSCSIFPDNHNYLINSINGSDILLKLDTVNQNNKKLKSAKPTSGAN